VCYTVSMIKSYPYKVTYRRRHPNPTYVIKNPDGTWGREIRKPYCDKEVSESEFMTKEKAELYIKRKKASGTGAYFKLHEGNFTVEEYSV
jgi:hypothetical protein